MHKRLYNTCYLTMLMKHVFNFLNRTISLWDQPSGVPGDGGGPVQSPVVEVAGLGGGRVRGAR